MKFDRSTNDCKFRPAPDAPGAEGEKRFLHEARDFDAQVLETEEIHKLPDGWPLKRLADSHFKLRFLHRR